MTLGAPPTLVATASQDAIDEIRHAELCFSLARSLDGQEQSPGSFPGARRMQALPRSRRLALAVLAIDSLVDGALHEGVSARTVAKLAKRCEQPAIRAILEEIAAGEGRHAAHGWQVLTWCIEQGGMPVVHALRGAVSALPHQIHWALPEASLDGGWERWGIAGKALVQEQYTLTRAHLRKRLDTQLRPLI